jgi:molybdate transport system permease protein
MSNRVESAPRRASRFGAVSARLLGFSLLIFLVVPVVALLLSSSPDEFMEGLKHPLVGPALWLSLKTTAISLAIILVAGTPLAWWLSRSSDRTRRLVEPLIELPIVIPPAVVGIALLDAFGRNGLFGDIFASLGWSIPFTSTAVIMAQVLVAAPFYIHSATTAFRNVEEDQLVVARTLGASPQRAFFSVAVPAALPGLMSGAALAWARAVGEFGATLLFAGSLKGHTQTMPLAIFDAFQSDVGAARATALVLAVTAILVLVLLRLIPSWWSSRRRRMALRISTHHGGA